MRCTAGCGQAGQAGKKGSLHASIAHEVEAEVERLLGEGVVEDFQAVEMEARRVALQIMGRAVAGKLNADRSDVALAVQSRTLKDVGLPQLPLRPETLLGIVRSHSRSPQRDTVRPDSPSHEYGHRANASQRSIQLPVPD